MDVTADEKKAQWLLTELTFGGHSWDGAEEMLATALNAARAEGARTALHDAADEGWGPEDQDYYYPEVSAWLRDRAAAIPTSKETDRA